MIGSGIRSSVTFSGHRFAVASQYDKAVTNRNINTSAAEMTLVVKENGMTVTSTRSSVTFSSHRFAVASQYDKAVTKRNLEASAAETIAHSNSVTTQASVAFRMLFITTETKIYHLGLK
jgi:PIN domain nuclease of toxin-antitoxin system